MTRLEHSSVVADTDPHGLAPSDPGAKLDAGKPMCGLLLDFGHALMEVAKVSTFGADKYSRGGWQHVEDGENRYTDAMLRHLFTGNFEERDAESKLLHAAQVAWNALARLELQLRAANKPKTTEPVPLDWIKDEPAPKDGTKIRARWGSSEHFAWRGVFLPDSRDTAPPLTNGLTRNE